MKPETRAQVNAQLKQRFGTEIARRSRPDIELVAADRANGDRSDPRREDHLDLDGPTPRERAMAELKRRGFVPNDAA